MKDWLARNAPAIEAAAAIVTAFVALAALIGVKYQLDAADVVQRSQSARDAYRSHLVLAVSKPDFARPADACVLIAGAEGGAYAAFVDHLLYSAEQMFEVEAGWETTFTDALAAHAPYVCSASAPVGSTRALSRFLAQFRASTCDAERACE